MTRCASYSTLDDAPISILSDHQIFIGLNSRLLGKQMLGSGGILTSLRIRLLSMRLPRSVGGAKLLARPHRLMARILPFQGSEEGSKPSGGTRKDRTRYWALHEDGRIGM